MRLTTYCFNSTRMLGQLLSLMICSLPAAADQARLTGAEATLNAVYQGKILVVRNFYEGSKLEFGADGTLIRAGRPGYWTTDGKVEIKKIRVRHKELAIDARRVWFSYDRLAKQFRAHEGASLEFRIQFDPDSATPDGLQSSIRRVFLTEQEKFEDVLPDYWRSFFTEGFEPRRVFSNFKLDDGSVPLTVGGDVKLPIPQVKPEPPTLPLRAGLGSVELSLWP